MTAHARRRFVPARMAALRALQAAALMGLTATPLLGAGQSAIALKDLVSGPILFLVAALGLLWALYQFARGNKQAAFFAIAGLIFLAFVRAALPAWLGPSAMGTNAWTDLGELPVYGQTPGVLSPGELHMAADVRAWGYVGLYLSNRITGLLFSLWVPVLVAIAGAIVTYWRIAVRHQPGSVLSYLIGVMLVTAFAIVPWFTFMPKNLQLEESNDVIKAINAMNSTAGQTMFASSSSNPMQIPLLPALVLQSGVDITEAIGQALNSGPDSAYTSMLLQAARSYQLPEAWASEYADYVAFCAAAQQGYVLSESPSDTAQFSANTRAAALQHKVNAASENLLSGWGDDLFAFMPLHGYEINEEADWQALHSGTGNNTLHSLLLQSIAWVPPSLSYQEKIASAVHPGKIRFGDVQNGQFLTLDMNHYQLAEFQYTLPFGAGTQAHDFGLPSQVTANTEGISIVYCSVPSSAQSQLKIPTTASTDNQAIGWNNISVGGLNVTDRSQYTADIVTIASNGVPSVVLDDVDIGNHIRQDLIATYVWNDTNQVCHDACVDSGNKNYWGCLISGQFITLKSQYPECTMGSTLTTVFYSQGFAAAILGALYPSAASPRDLSTLSALQGHIIGSEADWVGDPAQVRIAVDFLLGAPGTYGQNPLATNPFDPPTYDQSSSFSLWNILSALPKAGMWLLSCLGVLASTIISAIWPHFVGIILLIYLLLYPIFAIIALWPGSWPVLLGWIRGLFGVLMWAPVVSLGFDFFNGGAVLSQTSGFFSSFPSPGQSIMTLLGAAIVLLAPMLAHAVMHPTYHALQQISQGVINTAFRIIGMGAGIGFTVGARVMTAVADSMHNKDGSPQDTRTAPRQSPFVRLAGVRNQVVQRIVDATHLSESIGANINVSAGMESGHRAVKSLIDYTP